MKFKTGMILIILSTIFFSKFSSALYISKNRDLHTILKVVEQNKIEIKEWNIYYRIIKENIDKKTLNQKVSAIRRDKSFIWTEDGDGNQPENKTITGIKRGNNDERQIILAFVKNGEHYNLYITY